ncbi:hypothetical protein C2G38_2197306 [Gigaspora rosea]|uniref:Uncharacterized protein n=1 Tax=Gigaspora rosea TaxID=44941 RepID=A0A397UWU7_9GLOM|nr:hypothetical protein C2G38_2197306 [Gigaspora rosea]
MEERLQFISSKVSNSDFTDDEQLIIYTYFANNDSSIDSANAILHFCTTKDQIHNCFRNLIPDLLLDNFNFPEDKKTALRNYFTKNINLINSAILHSCSTDNARYDYLTGLIPESLESAFFEDGHILVLCMNKDMAVKLLHAQYFQVDLTFKRVCGKINEFELNKYDINYNITFMYTRIFTNIATANAYHHMFKAIIEAVNELCKQEVQIRHIHNNGWKVILGDLDAAQAKGLGLVLADLDPTKPGKLI